MSSLSCNTLQYSYKLCFIRNAITPQNQVAFMCISLEILSYNYIFCFPFLLWFFQTAKHIEVIIQKAYLHSSSSLGHAMRNPVISIWAKVVIPVCTVILVLISVSSSPMNSLSSSLTSLSDFFFPVKSLNSNMLFLLVDHFWLW